MSTEAEDLQRRIAEEKAALRQNTSQSNVRTFPMPDRPALASGTAIDAGGAPVRGPALSSASPPPGGIANGERTPVSSEASGSQGGGADPLVQGMGTPDEMMAKVPPVKAYTLAMESADAVANNKKTAQIENVAEQKAKVNAELEQMTGKPVDKSIAELQEMQIAKLDAAYEAGEISKEQHKGLKKGWKNFFNIVPREDFGLFMMDFGLRMLATSGGDYTLGEQIGIAGGGALQGSLGRTAAKQQAGYERTKAGMEQGIDIYEAETGRMNAEANRDRASLAGQGYQGEKAWLLNLGRSIGKSDDEIWDMFNKVDAPEVRRQKLWDFIRELKVEATITQKDQNGKAYRDYTDSDMREWVDKAMEIELQSSAVASALSKYGDQGE